MGKYFISTCSELDNGLSNWVWWTLVMSNLVRIGKKSFIRNLVENKLEFEGTQKMTLLGIICVGKDHETESADGR